jgi:outer membrane autotransporter protein
MSHFKAAKPARISSFARTPQGRHRVQPACFTPSLLVLALAGALALPGLALADTWTGTVSDDWFTGGNWSSGVPAANATIIVDTAPNPATIDTGAVTASGVSVGTIAGSTGSMIIQNGGTLDSSTASIGEAVNSTGTVMVDGVGSSWQGPDSLSVGNAGTGTLNIFNGGAVSDQKGYVGRVAGSTGTVSVSGTGSSWSHSGHLIVGVAGTGTVAISAAGSINNVNAYIGNVAGSTGTVSVDGAGSTWFNSGTLVVGESGQGTLAITNGGMVSAATSVVGEQAGGQGTASVSGANSAWNHTADLFVGYGGNGALTIANGGAVTDVTGYIGGIAGGTGTVQVNGAGSTWTNTGGLAVGNFGAGTLAISNGGTVLSIGSTLGNYAGSTGTVMVDGAGSAMLNDAVLTVGGDGNGTLVISNGGVVNNTAAIVGNHTGSSGAVTVDGVGSTWTSSSDLYVGSGGTGSLSIANGGKVSDVAGYVGNFAGGTATVDGPGSTWTNSASMVVGSSATGTLVITNGGVLSNDQGYVGSTAAGTGTATVDGAGSAWNNSLDLRVGEYGNGTLNVSNGGAVNNATGWVGNQVGSTGTVNVSGANATWTSAGNLYVGNEGAGNLNIRNGGTVNNAAGVLAFAGTSTGTATVDGAGSAWLSGAELYVGYGGNGTLTLSNGGLAGIAGFYVSVASLAGSTGTLNIGGAAGAAPTGPGTLQASLLKFGAGTGTINFNHTDTSGNYDFNSAVSGQGTLNQNAGWTTMAVDSSAFTGPVNINGGRLSVNGAGSLIGASATNVNNGGTLAGTGFVGNTVVNAGGMVAPGITIGAVHTQGTLRGNGSFTFEAGSTYQVEVDAAGNADKLVTFGKVVLNGGTVQVLAANGNYAAATPYTIVSAGNGVTGTFAGVTSNTVFLDPSLSYADPFKVDLTLTRNSTPMGSVGQTPGQTSTGTGVQSLGAGAVYNAVLGLSAAQARNAFQQLSGEVHASARSVQVQDSHFMRDASLERLRALDSEVIANDGGADDEGKARLLPSVRDLAYWARAMGSWGHLDGTGGAATVNRDTSGFLMGADTRFGEEGRFGLTGGYSRSSFDVTDRSSSGSSDNYHLGAYAGNRWGDLALRTGISYSWHDVSTSRVVAFPGFIDSLKADYKAGTTQAFAELGYRIKTEKAEFEPFANLAHVNVSSDGFTERGGAAALTSAGSSDGVTFSTLGLRASTKVAMSGGADVTARGAIGWRHAFGDTSPTSTVAFAGGAPFAITGAPVARNAAVVEGGLDFRLSNAATLGLSYAGQFGSGLKDHGARLNLNVAF